MVLMEVVVFIGITSGHLLRACTTMNHICEASAKLYEGTPMYVEELFVGDPDSGYKQHTPLPMLQCHALSIFGHHTCSLARDFILTIPG